MTTLKLKVELLKIEKELDKVRTSSFIDGWQTQRHAKKSRKWDTLAQRKMNMISLLDTVYSCERDLHNDDIYNLGNCLNCNSGIGRYDKRND